MCSPPLFSVSDFIVANAVRAAKLEYLFEMDDHESKAGTVCVCVYVCVCMILKTGTFSVDFSSILLFHCSKLQSLYSSHT